MGQLYSFAGCEGQLSSRSCVRESDAKGGARASIAWSESVRSALHIIHTLPHGMAVGRSLKLTFFVKTLVTFFTAHVSPDWACLADDTHLGVSCFLCLQPCTASEARDSSPVCALSEFFDKLPRLLQHTALVSVHVPAVHAPLAEAPQHRASARGGEQRGGGAH